jgi:NADPH:quinone reductase-like Zn-dependent oxidoreductase
MKALILEEFNQAYQLKEIKKPAPGKGEVLIKVIASGVNPLDLKIKAGQAAHAKPKLPAILGIDVAGIIEAVGENVTAFNPGDEVYGMAGGIAGIPGSLAEYMVADEKLLAIKPKNLSMKQAAALPLIFITAWEGLIDRAKTGTGKTVLIHGGAGGVGHIAVQIAKATGAEVFSTVDASKNDLIKNYGAIPIDYKSLTVEEYVNEYTHGEGFDIVFDTVGGEVLDNSFKATRQYYGHVISILGWGTHSLAPLSFRGATYSGVFTLYPLISGFGRAHHGEILREATLLIEKGLITPNVDPQTFTPHNIEEAYKHVNTAKGKIVIDMFF